jgi:5-methylcytosine-specific restriction protein A
MGNRKKIRPIAQRVKRAADRLKPGDSWRAQLPGSTARGYGYAWQVARLDYLAEHPLCVMCQARGIITAASIVDHKRPHRGDMVLFWDVSNWQALCVNCHSEHKQRQEARSR